MATTYREGQVIHQEGSTPPADPAVESPAAPVEPEAPPAEPAAETEPEPADEQADEPAMTAPKKRKAKKR